MKLPVVDFSGFQEDIFNSIESHLANLGFRIVDRALDKPWGGFYVIDEAQAKDFAAQYFPEIDFNTISIIGRLSPKILAVAPGKRLSWQYHYRRAEIWRLVAGKAAITTSDDDVERNNREIQMGEVIRLKQGERHRLIGLDNWLS